MRPVIPQLVVRLAGLGLLCVLVQIALVSQLSVFGTKGRVSEVVNGKRDISKEQAKKLAAFFHVSANLFI